MNRKLLFGALLASLFGACAAIHEPEPVSDNEREVKSRQDELARKREVEDRQRDLQRRKDQR